MPIDTSIYQLLRPVEVARANSGAAFSQGMSQGMNMRQLAMQEKRAETQDRREAKQEEMQDQENKLKLHLQRASVVGNALESMSGMTEQERAAAYTKVRADLIGAGVLNQGDAPEQYDPGFYRHSLMRFKQSKEGIERQLESAKIGKLRAETAKDYAEANSKANGKGPGFELSSNLRKEWTGLPTTKATQDVAQSIERVRNAYANPSAAGDLTMIYSFMKMNDPGSTVREGEFATAQNAAGVPDRVRAAWNKALNGERLTEEQRQDFAQQAERMYGGQINAQKTVDDQYKSLAGRYGVDPSLVMIKFPDPKELKLAVKKEEERPGFFGRMFGTKTAHAAETVPDKNVPESSKQDKPNQFDEDVVSYAQKHGITNEQALAIKKQRMGN